MIIMMMMMMSGGGVADDDTDAIMVRGYEAGDANADQTGQA